MAALRVLIVHNFYSSKMPSGENAAAMAELRLLEKNGHVVDLFSRQSDGIRSQGVRGMLRGGLATVWNPWMASAMKKRLYDFKPDVVHVHNTFPLISPSIFSAIGSTARRVMTLHNYRAFCPAAIPMREGKVCTLCIDQRTVIPAIRYGCYRDSSLATAPLAANVAVHRALGTWQKHVDAFIALSAFQRKKVIEAGLPAEKVFVKPNFHVGSPRVQNWEKRSDYVIFVGRLSIEKGLIALLEAWQKWGPDAPELRLVGDGPLKERLSTQAQGLPVRFLGQLPRSQTQAQIANARLLVLPSECFEGFPLVIGEAFALGTPVAVSNLGPLPSVVSNGQNGVVFEPGSATSIHEVIRSAWRSPGKLEAMAGRARAEFEEKYTEEANLKKLLEIYSKSTQ